MSSWRKCARITVVTALLCGAGTTAASAAPAVEAVDDPRVLGKALAGDVGWVTGAAFESRPDPAVSAVASCGLAGFPTTGGDAVVLSTGRAQMITEPNNSGSSGTDLGGLAGRGDSAFDVTVLRVDLQVPATANCLVGLDLRFLSEGVSGIRRLALQRRVRRRARPDDLIRKWW